MENTLENKSRFFALYYGQEVLTRDDGFRKFWKLGSEVSIESSLSKYGYDYGYYLELTPLSQITDEDTKYLEIYDCSSIDEYGYQFMMGTHSFWDMEEADYLRYKGYALPWMGLSVKTLVEYGWVKLKEN